jgi:hypothetical protein
MPLQRTEVEYQQPFVRFLRVNGNPLPKTDQVMIDTTQDNTFMVAVSPPNSIVWTVFLLSSDGTATTVGSAVTKDNVVAAGRILQFTIAAAGTPLVANGVQYLLRVASPAPAANASSVCEIELVTL